MPLREKINEQFNAALKSKNKTLVSALRLVLAAIKDRDIANRTSKKKEVVKDDEIVKVLRKMNAMQEVEKLRDNISNKVISENDKLKVSIKEEVGYTASQEIIGDINEKSGCD